MLATCLVERKSGCVVVLLRYLCSLDGLCNETKCKNIMIEVYRTILPCRILNSDKKDDNIHIPRVTFHTTGNTDNELI